MAQDVRVSINGPGDRLTLKLICESHLTWGTFIPKLGTLGLWVLELFAMYATDGRTDGRTKATLIVPFPMGGGITLNIASQLERQAVTVQGHYRGCGITAVCKQKQ